PIYFSDVVVRRDSPFYSFAQLRGASWAFNEPNSHSGYNVARARLAELGVRQGFFREAVESGAHSVSLEMISDGRVDGAAIDSTVLEWLAIEQPELNARTRIVETIGPSPIPPWVISTKVAKRWRRKLRAALLEMHRDRFGREVLACGRLRRFAAAQDADYDAIRAMARIAAEVSFA
ncbi:MAG TPA: PhnD/SsuA/transferrin family substrate-binding protein, partial [Terriglobales bacterium]|nr:PhnD/SsuA/transferrin family substrate-binding protein [Terriglobales bacterium]